MDFKTLFLSANGRIRRRDFWVGFLIIFAASFVSGMIPVIGQVIGLVLIWPQVCIHAKRLHDMGRTGWLQVIPMAVALVAVIAGVVISGPTLLEAMASEDPVAIMAAAGPALGAIGFALLFGLAFLLWVGLTPGQPGDNRFGPPPAAATEAST